MTKKVDMMEYVRNSNLIENIDSGKEDRRSARAWNWFIDQPVISVPVLLELHRRITHGQLPKGEAGEFRRVQVYVGNHIPPAPGLVIAQTGNWLWDLMEQVETLDPKEMHIRFETIHPFVDGNGRTGRMLMWWHEHRQGKIPTLISFENRSAYYQWFTEARK